MTPPVDTLNLGTKPVDGIATGQPVLQNAIYVTPKATPNTELFGSGNTNLVFNQQASTSTPTPVQSTLQAAPVLQSAVYTQPVTHDTVGELSAPNFPGAMKTGGLQRT